MMVSAISGHLGTNPDQMLTEQQVADLVCQSVRTLQKWRLTGSGPAFCKLGQSVRYRTADVLNWITARRVAHTAQATLLSGANHARRYRIKEILRWARRNGADMYHWVTEFTRQSRPHLHLCVYVGNRDRPGHFGFELTEMWLQQTGYLATTDRGQHWRVIDTLSGWLEYVGKHASRGYEHYQREKDSLPKSWTVGTGKMWGCSRNWPKYSEKYVLSDFIWFEYRRLIKRWTISQARTKLMLALKYSDEREQRQCLRTLRERKRLYTRNTEKNSAVVGVSQWVPREISELMLFHLAKEYPGQIQTQEEHEKGPFVPF